MALNATSPNMLAVVWNGQPFNMTVETRPKPTIVNQTDAIVRISSAAICGTDLHVYHGIYGSAQPGWIMGHEGVGYVDSIGSGVQYHNVGDYVVVPDNFGSGHFPSLQASTGMAPGYGPDLTAGEDVGGCQAQYVRVPFADNTLYPIPKTPNGSWDTARELDYVMTSDIFATAWQGVTWSGFEPGDTVAVFGAGPVGQMAAYSASIRGASRIYIIDRIESRLRLAEKNTGAIPINYRNASAAQQVLAREPNGVARSVDAVGFESRAANGSYEVDLVLREAVQITRTLGGIGIVGVYDSSSSAPGRPRASMMQQLEQQQVQQSQNSVLFNPGTAFGKALRVHMGVVDARQLASQLIRLISSGKASPGYIVSSKINITQAPEYYRRFSNWEESKVIIQF